MHLNFFFDPSYSVMTLVAMVSSKLGKESNECQEHVSYYEKMHINLKNNKRSTGFAYRDVSSMFQALLIAVKSSMKMSKGYSYTDQKCEPPKIPQLTGYEVLTCLSFS